MDQDYFQEMDRVGTSTSTMKMRAIKIESQFIRRNKFVANTIKIYFLLP